MLLRHCIEKQATIDSRSGPPGLWCPSAAEGWQPLAVSLRNKRWEAGMSHDELRENRLCYKHSAYSEIEYNHLEPISAAIERCFKRNRGGSAYRLGNMASSRARDNGSSAGTGDTADTTDAKQ
ncbi:hypothetical protein F5B17DRAFT_433733 [Nemania serpens]|nr:hypothetical protein F5B17DRAFT_433733 [Nemania serpens]